MTDLNLNDTQRKGESGGLLKLQSNGSHGGAINLYSNRRTIGYLLNLSPLDNSPPSEGLGEVPPTKYPYILIQKKAEKMTKNIPF